MNFATAASPNNSAVTPFGLTRLATGGIDLSPFGLTIPEILAALMSAKLPDYGDPFDVHTTLRAQTPHQLLERNVTRCFFRPGDPEPAEATASQLEIRIDATCDESGVVREGWLNALLYDRSNSPWADSEPTLAERALAAAAKRKRAGSPRPWNVSDLQAAVRTEHFRQFGRFISSAASGALRLAKNALRLQLWWGVACLGTVGPEFEDFLEARGEIAALITPLVADRRRMSV